MEEYASESPVKFYDTEMMGTSYVLKCACVKIKNKFKIKYNTAFVLLNMLKTYASII